MQMVILAGGLAKRLGPLTKETPKCMMCFKGRTFLEHQIDLLKKNQLTDIVLCVGHLADRIQAHFGDGSQYGVNIRYSVEQNGLLGTGGALKKAEPLLENDFLLMYGDSYLLLDYQGIMKRFRDSGKLGLMVAYRNMDCYDRSNLVLESDMVKTYDKKCSTPDMVWIDEGLSALRKEALVFLPGDQVTSLEDLFCRLIEQRQLVAYETCQRFYEIGSPAGLEEFKRLTESGEIPS